MQDNKKKRLSPFLFIFIQRRKTEYEQRKKQKKKAAGVIGCIIGIAGLTAAAYLFGRFDGKRKFIDGLIDECMTDKARWNMDFPVVFSSKPQYGSLMFEISAECIGD